MPAKFRHTIITNRNIMKSLIFALVLMYPLYITAQSAEEIQKHAAKVETERVALWKDGRFKDAAALLKKELLYFSSLNSDTRALYNSYNYGTLYNIACAYSQADISDSAVAYLDKSVEAGFSDFTNASADPDLFNIRNDARFKKILASIREKGDYDYILKKYGAYEKSSNPAPRFTYQSPDSKGLVNLRTKYNLDSVAGNGNEISRFINLMKWVHNSVKHDGGSTNPIIKTADALIQVCKKTDRGVNCRMMATILNEVYLSMGYKSRFITCMPKGEKFDDCHVINEVYSNTLKKWLWMDPTFETVVTDGEGNLLSIRETRYRLVNNLPVKASDEINWNGAPYSGGGDKYLHSYMTKNLFRFSIPLNSCQAFENRPASERVYLDLYPVGYNPTNVQLDKITNNNYYTTDDEQFWAGPVKD